MTGARKSFFHGLYAWLIIFMGYGMLIAILQVEPLDLDLWREYAVLVVLGVLAEWFVVSVPQGSLSLGFAVVLVSFIRFDTTTTVLVSVLSAFIANSIVSKDRFFRSTLFNGAQYTISAVAASTLYFYAGGHAVDKITAPNIIPLAFFVLTYFFINHFLVSLFLLPSFRNQRLTVWRSALKWDCLTYLFAAPIGVLMALIYEKTGTLGAVLIFIPLLTLKYLLRLYINLETANKELSALYEVAKNLGSNLELSKTLGLILSETKRVVNYHTGVIYLWEEEEQLLVPAAIKSPFAEKLRSIAYSLEEGLIGQVAKTGQPGIVYDSKKDNRLRSVPGINQFLRSLLIIPLAMDNKLIGVIAIGKKEPNAFGQKQVQILSSLGGQAAVAMANAVLYKKIEKLAITDGLTKVYNHRYFYKRMEEENERYRRYGTVFSFIMLDLDYFKQFNDKYGHRAGDHALYTVAQVIKKSTRMLDVVSRYGGEEFAVILPETDAANARVVAERILNAIRDNYFSVSDDHPPVHVTVSIGVATCPQDAETTNDLIELADKALYYSKETGKNKISVWSEVPIGALVDNG
ncbi:diguanylate cyclase [Phosphitispora sp. TUW77]|uniref:sensor domain-containing diguanylate cyclase n=1 Tax=Phosphitispora sp. TUW77 TaxID=3152361 RepID=UPI003AB1C989